RDQSGAHEGPLEVRFLTISSDRRAGATAPARFFWPSRLSSRDPRQSLVPARLPCQPPVIPNEARDLLSPFPTGRAAARVRVLHSSAENKPACYRFRRI